MAVPMYSETEAECRRLRSALRACEVLINKEGEENDATLRAMQLLDEANAELVEQREEARAQAAKYRHVVDTWLPTKADREKAIISLHLVGSAKQDAIAAALEALADV